MQILLLILMILEKGGHESSQNNLAKTLKKKKKILHFQTRPPNQCIFIQCNTLQPFHNDSKEVFR